MHEDPVPRGGGIGILAGVMIGVASFWYAFSSWESWLIGFASLALAIVALLDDQEEVSPLWRLVIQVIAACCLLFALYHPLFGSIPPYFIGWKLLFAIILASGIVWSINLYNFMDGMDGLATAMAIIGFSCLAWFGWQGGEVMYTSLALVLVAACVGFLPFNFHPARMFMGDVGSTLLGFWAVGFSLWGIALDLYPWWVPLVVFAAFWVDATVTLLHRIWKREKIFQAHKSHIYQRLVGSGLGQHRTLLLEIVLMMTCALIAVRIVQTS
jgi:UDP-N-acetylmuramyl pentapeptide phosphotransferase/UDP-N-acetylglucosamine-1-phosphate transferase